MSRWPFSPLLIALALAFPAAALAQESTPPSQPSGCVDPDRPIEEPSELTFDQATDLFAKGAEPAPEQLEGTWIHVMTTNLPELGDGEDFFTGKNGQCSSGTLNKDGSDYKRLEFTGSLKVSILGSRHTIPDQGPFDAERRDGSVFFSQHAYGGRPPNDSMYEDIFFGYECRILYERGLLCAMKPLPSTHPGAWEGWQSQYVNRVITYFLYRKKGAKPVIF